MLYELNGSYHSCIFLENKTNSYFESCSINKSPKRPKNLVLICQQNLFYAQKLKKKVHNKDVKY